MARWHVREVEPPANEVSEQDTWFRPSTGCRFHRISSAWVAENVPCAATLREPTVGGGGNTGTTSLAVPTGLPAMSIPDRSWFGGPFMSAAGIRYFVALTAANLPAVYRSPDGGATWAEIDAAGRPTVLSAHSLWVAPDPRDPDTLVIGTARDDAGGTITPYFLHRFSMAQDRWTVRDVQVSNALAHGANGAQISLVVRSNGDVVLGYGTGNLGGDDPFGTLRYAILTAAGVWTRDVLVDGAGGGTAASVSLVLGLSDRVHFFYPRTAAPTSIRHRSLDNTNAFDAIATPGQMMNSFGAIGRGVSYLGADGLTYVVVPYLGQGAVPVDGRVLRLQSMANPPITIETFSAALLNGGSRQTCCAALRDTSVWVMFDHNADLDLYSDHNNGGDGWRTDTLEVAGITFDGVSCNFIGSPGVLAFVYRNSIGPAHAYMEKTATTAPASLGYAGLTVPDEEVNPLAPGAGLTTVRSVSGQMVRRTGAAGAVSLVFDDAHHIVGQIAAARSLDIRGHVTGGAPAQRDVGIQTGNAANPQVLVDRIVVGSNAAQGSSIVNIYESVAVLAGSNPATAGAIRLPNAQFMYARNFLNTVDFPLIGLNASNEGSLGVQGSAPSWVLPARDGVNAGGYLAWKGAGANADFSLDNNAGSVRMIINAQTRFTFDAATNFVPGADGAGHLGINAARFIDAALSSMVAIGTNPASAGALRLQNATWVAARNFLNNGNINIWQVNASDQIAGGAAPVLLNQQLYPATDALATQTACALFAGTGAPNNANGANGDIYFRSDGGGLTTVYQKRAGAWVGIV